MLRRLIGGELACRVCGLPQLAPIWGTDGRSPTYEICARCACCFGVDDTETDAIVAAREKVVAANGDSSEAPRFRFRMVAGLPSSGEITNFPDATVHGEGIVVEMWADDQPPWMGNYRCGRGGASGVLACPWSREHAVVFADGNLYVVEPKSRQLVFQVGPEIDMAVPVAEHGLLLLGSPYWLGCVDVTGLLWRRPAEGRLNGLTRVGPRTVVTVMLDAQGVEHELQLDIFTGKA